MNPFDLSGPDFLVFYLALSVVVVGATALLRWWLESGPVPKLGNVDPYQVAYLRGGYHEAIRVATISLLDRGLLRMEGDSLIAGMSAVNRARRPLEKAILQAFLEEKKAPDLFHLPGPREACKPLVDALREKRLLPTENQVFVRVILGAAALLILCGVALIKVDIAISRGRQNFQLLVGLALVTSALVVTLLRTPRTPAGNRIVEDYKTLFSRLKERAGLIRPGGATNELALLAGVFGLGALSGSALDRAQALFPQGAALQVSTTSWGTSCGAISTDSSGGSCGSSCGGGGCGGGCGGCGG
ncbi:MAG TPA: TIGR04222 domain-containing membrane protein [Myxococcales bacterium]|nr:TIGR04222 domain-containing membrane protein [Myxococcales bacterium]